MALIVHTSFLALTEAAIKAHIDEIVGAKDNGAERRQLMAYLQQTLANDRKAHRANRKLLAYAAARIDEAILAQQFDYTKQTALFTPSSGTDYAALLATDNADVIVPGHAFGGEVLIAGDNVHLDGRASGSARDGTLVCTATATTLQITGDNAVVQGIKFVCGSANKGVYFGANVHDVVIRDCIFESDGQLASSPDNRWFWQGTGLSGKVRLENCRVYNFNGWGLGDLTTESGAPAAGSELDQVRIQSNVFHNCTGSFAIRGVQASPTKYCRIYDNETKFTDGVVMHPLYWSVFEVNNCATVICKSNVLTGGTRIGTGQGRGYLQTWSKSSDSWHLEFEKNRVAGIDYVLQLAAIATFYSPDQTDDRFLVKSEAGKITDCTYGMGLFYPWESGAWAPANLAQYAAAPSPAWADGLADRA